MYGINTSLQACLQSKFKVAGLLFKFCYHIYEFEFAKTSHYQKATPILGRVIFVKTIIFTPQIVG